MDDRMDYTDLEQRQADMAEPAAAAPVSYADMTDEEVVAQCRTGDAVAVEYLLNKYKNFVRSRARSYFLIGADHEDIVQEGMIGLYKAIRDFRPEKLASFRAFAELCITRQIITAIKTATRQKHIPLNSYVSLNKPLYDEESDRTLLDVCAEGHSTNPEELLISQEDLRGIHQKIDEVLSGLEQEARPSPGPAGRWPHRPPGCWRRRCTPPSRRSFPACPPAPWGDPCRS